MLLLLGGPVPHICPAAGWRSALQALTVAATDPVPAVVNGALRSIMPVIESLYRCKLVAASGQLPVRTS